jgi:nucleoside-diphosphate-sugar epimerase
VKDTAAGFAAILHSEHLYGEVTNIEMNREISIGDLTRLIAKQLGREVEIVQEE